MNIADAFATWNSDIRPAVVEQYSADDEPALSESWNNYTDMLNKDGELTGLQYHYCPAYDDAMPEDDDAERDYILDQMNVSIEYSARSKNDHAVDFPEGSKHFQVTIKRGTRGRMAVLYSMGPKCEGNPQRDDVLYCLIMDAHAVDMVDSYEEYAEEYDMDADSREGERTYKKQLSQTAHLRGLFSDVAFDDLAALFEDY